jgi:hypothetical protein
MDPRAPAGNSRVKDTIEASDLPAACRTWDGRRRAWVPKTRWASEHEAEKDAPRGQRAYRCKAGAHFHLGHPSKGKR